MLKILLITLLSQMFVACGDEPKEFPKYDTLNVLGTCNDMNVGQAYMDKSESKLVYCLDGNWVQEDSK